MKCFECRWSGAHCGDEVLIVTTTKTRVTAERRLRAVSRKGKLAYWFGEPDQYATPIVDSEDMTETVDGKVIRSVEVGASPAELFALVADPRRHSELDGSGTVTGNFSAPSELVEGSKFSTKMKMFGIPYRLTSTVTELTPERTVEWRHPFGHHWRWEFEPTAPGRTRVTETFDYSNRKWYYRGIGFVKSNTSGIEATLAKLRDRYPVG